MLPGHKKSPPVAPQYDKSYEPVVQLMRARICHQGKQYDEAKSLYKKVLKKAPNNFQALHFLGLAEYETGKMDQAIRNMKRALLVEPNSAEAHSDIGCAYIAVHDMQKAAFHCNRAIELDPTLAAAYCNLGNAQFSSWLFDEALASHDKAIELKPDYADAWNNRGNVLHKLGRYDEALASYKKASELDPYHQSVFLNLATTYKSLKQLDAALACYDRALASGKMAVEAGIGRTELLMNMRNVQDAMKTCLGVLEVEPKNVMGLTLLGTCMAALGDPDTAITLYDRALAISPGYDSAIGNKIFSLDFSTGADTKVQQDARKLWWDRIGVPIYTAHAAPHDNDRDPDRKLVLGYVSADFRTHSAGFTFYPVLKNHDRSKFEVICYSGLIVPDPMTKLFEAAADKWRDMSQWSDAKLSECIRDDKVDILIDLSGHSAGNRLGVFARRPAPVQITAWGHATGTGLKTIDYLFSDPVAIPENVRPYYAEAIYDLPSLVIIEPPPAEWRSAELPFDRNGYLTYGVFNRASKFSERSFDVWGRILGQNPTARLVVKDAQIDDPAMLATLKQKFLARGVAAERITFLGGTGRGIHLQNYGAVDVCLDPFPQSGGVSTWEALHMGTPVVTLPGNTIASRLSAGILASIGLDNWISDSEDRYVEIACNPDLDELRRLRRDIGSIIDARCGPVVYTHAVEAAYREMWTKYCTSPVDEAALRAKSSRRPTK